MFLKIKKIFSSKVVQGSFIITLTSLFANFFSYLFQLLAGRALSVSDYGILIALFSVQALVGLPTGIIANAVTKKVTEIKDIDYPNGLSLFFYSLFKLNLIFSLVTVIVLFFFKSYVLTYLNISATGLYFPFLLYVFFSMLFVYDRSFLQALHRYKALSILNISQSLGKLLTAGIVLYLALDLIWVFVLLSIFILLFELVSLTLLFKNIHKKYGVFSSEHLVKILKFSFLSSFGFIGVSLILNNDVLLVKHLFSEDVAGYYSSSAIIGRIIFYGASPLAVVLF